MELRLRRLCSVTFIHKESSKAQSLSEKGIFIANTLNLNGFLVGNEGVLSLFPE